MKIITAINKHLDLVQFSYIDICFVHSSENMQLRKLVTNGECNSMFSICHNNISILILWAGALLIWSKFYICISAQGYDKMDLKFT